LSDNSNDWLATLANAPLPGVKAGVACYEKLGVPASQLVLAFPWYAHLLAAKRLWRSQSQLLTGDVMFSCDH
jgi:hypothetical protein